MSDAVPFLLVAGFLAASVVWQMRRVTVAKQKVVVWAHRNGGRVLAARWTIRPLPFFFASRSQVKLNVVIQGPEGELDEGVALVGGWFTGLLSDNVRFEPRRRRR